MVLRRIDKSGVAFLYCTADTFCVCEEASAISHVKKDHGQHSGEAGWISQDCDQFCSLLNESQSKSVVLYMLYDEFIKVLTGGLEINCWPL